MHSVPERDLTDLTGFPEGDDVIASKFERFSVIIGERRWAGWVKAVWIGLIQNLKGIMELLKNPTKRPCPSYKLKEIQFNDIQWL